MKNFFFLVQLLGVVVVLLLIPFSVSAQWSHDPFVNTPVCTVIDSQTTPVSISDGAGGVIIAWADRSYSNWNIFAQRYNAAGTRLWTNGGIGVYIGDEDQLSPAIASDGAGGAIIAWMDYRSGTNWDIYAQRINGSGVAQWVSTGNNIAAYYADQTQPQIISDGYGGAIITWQDYYSGNWDIYAQRINSSGTFLWYGGGVAACTESYEQSYPTLVTDGSGGAIITWNDFRSGGLFYAQIFAQRINSGGSTQWTADGISVTSTLEDQGRGGLISDNAGGAIIPYMKGNWDFMSSHYNIYAQRINANGSKMWGDSGNVVCDASGLSSQPNGVSDEKGGVIITWVDGRNAPNFDIYAQRLSFDGINFWQSNGIMVGSGPEIYSLSPIITGDSYGGAIISWINQAFVNAHGSDLYAQRITSAGVNCWNGTGVPISTANGWQLYPTVVATGTGGAIISWQDYRNTNTDWPPDIYTQYIDRCGYLGNNSPQLTKIKDVVGDQGGVVTVAWDSSYVDRYPNTIISYYSVWRGISVTGSTMKTLRLLQPEEMRNNFNGSGYCSRTINGVTTNWEWVGNVPSHNVGHYSFTAPTTTDSSASGTPYFKFFVSAQTSDPLLYWDSNVDSGYSVDNLSPSSLTVINASLVAGTSIKVHWKENITDPDVSSYEIHRSASNGFIPDQSTKLDETTDTLFIDTSPLTGENYYRVIVVDIHSNKSAPSVQVSAATTITSVLNVNNKWNMISVPMAVSNYKKIVLFPSSVSNAFAYAGGYVISTTLANGIGYWLKFDGEQSIPITGTQRIKDTINVVAGWNLIGSISTSITTAQVSSSPPGLVTSQFFGYDNGYVPSSSIDPGKAYWVKVNQAGQLILSSVVSNQTIVNRIRIESDSELPPSPPDELNSNNPIIPGEFALEQNYPNPFNPSTTISYQIPEIGTQHAVSVQLKVYNLLGEEVATLINAIQDVGYKSVTFDASKLPSGVYIYKLNAGTWFDMKKMIITK